MEINMYCPNCVSFYNGLPVEIMAFSPATQQDKSNRWTWMYHSTTLSLGTGASTDWRAPGQRRPPASWRVGARLSLLIPTGLYSHLYSAGELTTNHTLTRVGRAALRLPFVSDLQCRNYDIRFWQNREYNYYIIS